MTDNSGFYELTNITPGTYQLSVSMIGFRRYVSSVFEVNHNSVEFDAITLRVSLEQIEIITTPPARYDAEGDAGIIHIKMTEFAEMGTTGMAGGNAGYN